MTDWEWFRGLSDHTLNRIVATIDFLSLPLMFLEVISEGARTAIRSKAENVINKIDDVLIRVPYTRFSGYTIWITALLLVLYFLFSSRIDDISNPVIRGIAQFYSNIIILLTCIIVSIMQVRNFAAEIIVVSLSVVYRFRLFCFGLILFVVGQLATLIHG